MNMRCIFAVPHLVFGMLLVTAPGLLAHSYGEAWNSPRKWPYGRTARACPPIDVLPLAQEARRHPPGRPCNSNRPRERDKFVDGPYVFAQIESGMKDHTAQLAAKGISRIYSPADDIVDTPEFYNAYMFRNSGTRGTVFPNRKFNLKTKSPTRNIQ